MSKMFTLKIMKCVLSTLDVYSPQNNPTTFHRLISHRYKQVCAKTVGRTK